MIEAVRDVSQARLTDNSSVLDIGIGIASGSVALGMIGNKDNKTLSAIGYRVNLAVNLENQARPSEIIIDENTFSKIDSMRSYFSLSTFLGEETVRSIQTYSYLIK